MRMSNTLTTINPILLVLNQLSAKLLNYNITFAYGIQKKNLLSPTRVSESLCQSLMSIICRD